MGISFVYIDTWPTQTRVSLREDERPWERGWQIYSKISLLPFTTGSVLSFKIFLTFPKNINFPCLKIICRLSVALECSSPTSGQVIQVERGNRSSHDMCVAARSTRWWQSRFGPQQACLRTIARKFSNIDFFLRLLPLKVDELVVRNAKKLEGHRLRLGENEPERTP